MTHEEVMAKLRKTMERELGAGSSGMPKAAFDVAKQSSEITKAVVNSMYEHSVDPMIVGLVGIRIVNGILSNAPPPDQVTPAYQEQMRQRKEVIFAALEMIYNDHQEEFGGFFSD